MLDQLYSPNGFGFLAMKLKCGKPPVLSFLGRQAHMISSRTFIAAAETYSFRFSLNPSTAARISSQSFFFSASDFINIRAKKERGSPNRFYNMNFDASNVCLLDSNPGGTWFSAWDGHSLRPPSPMLAETTNSLMNLQNSFSLTKFIFDPCSRLFLIRLLMF